MKQIVLIILFLLSSFSANAEEGSTLERKISQLNQASIDSLGISLNALAYLVDASPNSYLTLQYLDAKEKYAIRELEEKGYVKIEISEGLPSGEEKNEKFLRIIPLDNGTDLKRTMLALIK